MQNFSNISRAMCLCRRSDFKVYSYHTKASEFQILACRFCHLGQTFPPPLLTDEIKTYYEQRQDYHQRREEIDLWNIFSSRFLKIVKKYARGKRLVDVGCNIGIFVKHAREADFEATGIDLADTPLQYGIKSLSLDNILHYGSLKDQEFKADSIDVLTYQHCFEHLANPIEELKEVYRVLKPTGIVLIEVPRFFSSWRFFLGNRWYGFSPDQHFWQFGKRGLVNLLKRENFKITAVKGRYNIYHKIGFNIQSVLKIGLYIIAWITATGDNLIIIATPIKK